MKKISLVLGGGGARGFFHAGVIKALGGLKIGISEVRGVSFGALMGLVYASSPERDIYEVVRSINMFRLFSFSSELISKKYVRRLLRKFVKEKNIEDLKLPFSFNAVDISSGKEVVFSKGKIFPAIFATMALPGVVAPVRRNGMLLCDGGISSNLPVHLAEKENVIACDVNPRPSVLGRKPGKVEIMLNMIFIMQEKITERILERSAGKNMVVLALDDSAGMFDFRRSTAERLMKKGYDAVMRNKKRIFQLAE
jgi:predicted acylesterase/phospholipase RssA